MSTRHTAAELRDPLLVGCLIVALVARIWSLDFGLPHRYHIDEPPQVVAALNLAQGSFQIAYPPLSPNLHQVLLLVLFIGLFVVQRLLGIVSSPLEFAALYQQDPTPFYLLARGLSAACSLVALVVLYSLVGRSHGRRIALLTCVFLALCFVYVRDAHFAKLYALLSLLVLVCVYLAMEYLWTGNNRLLIAAGIVSGVGIGLRYSVASLVLVPLTAVVLFAVQKGETARLKRVLNGVGHLLWSVPVGILIGTPSLLLNTKQVMSNLGVWAGYAVGSEGFEGFQFIDVPTWEFYLRMLEAAWGIPLLVVMLLGAGKMVVEGKRQSLVLFLFPITYCTVLLLAPAASSAFARFLVPVLPFFALLAAGGTSTAVDWLLGAQAPWIRNIGLGVIAASLVTIPSARIARLNTLWSQTDTRTLAKIWIEANIPQGTKVATQWHGPPLSTESDPEPHSLRTYEVEVLNPFSSAPELYSISYYRDNGFDYLILSSFIYELRRVDPAENALRDSFYATLDQQADLVAEFKPYVGEDAPPLFFEEIWGPITTLWQRERPGPTIKVYKVR